MIPSLTLGIEGTLNSKMPCGDWGLLSLESYPLPW